MADLWLMASGRTLSVLEERKTTEVELPINQDLLPLADNNVNISSKAKEHVFINTVFIPDTDHSTLFNTIQ